MTRLDSTQETNQWGGQNYTLRNVVQLGLDLLFSLVLNINIGTPTITNSHHQTGAF